MSQCLHSSLCFACAGIPPHQSVIQEISCVTIAKKNNITTVATANFNERHVADLYKECQTICFGIACCTLLGQCVKNMQAPYGRYWASWEQSVRQITGIVQPRVQTDLACVFK